MYVSYAFLGAKNGRDSSPIGIARKEIRIQREIMISHLASHVNTIKY